MSHALPMRGSRKCEGAQLGQMIQKDQRDIPHHGTVMPSKLIGANTLKGGQSGFRKGALASVSSWWTIAMCITFFFPFYYRYHNLVLLLYFTLFLIIQLLLSQNISFTLILLPLPLGRVGQKWGWASPRNGAGRISSWVLTMTTEKQQ